MATSTLPLLLVIFVSLLTRCVLSLQNIPLGSTLTTSNNSEWISPNGHFAFGFRKVTTAGPYFVAIWIQKISDKTIVWTPNITSFITVEEGSTLSLSASGLSLFDPQQSVLWSVKNSTSSALMKDDGNFVLFNGQDPTWQSFDTPTDTLLPGQQINSKYSMFSKVSDTNYSSGRFSLVMKYDGNLVLKPVENFGLPDWGAYWPKNDVMIEGSTNNPSSLVFNSSGLLYLVNATDTIVWNLTEGKTGQGEVFRRVTLDTDGILRYYVWERTENNNWDTLWQALGNPCAVTAQCGFNGVCQLKGSQFADCFCPPGYVFVDAADHFKGCRADDEFCNANNNTNMSMREMINTDWREAQGLDYYSGLTGVTDIQCKQNCMEDCFCSVAIYGRINNNDFTCWKKRSPLINGRQGENTTNKVYVKVCEIATQPTQPPTPKQKPPPSKQKKGKAVVVIVIALAGCSFAALVATVLLIWLRGCAPKIEAMEIDEGLKAFSYREIEAATGGFGEEVGRGAFGVVYKGRLSDGRAIAVKKLDKLEREVDRGEKEFRTEMRLIGNIHHKNLIQLFGFCHEGSHRLLVLEYMSNGSLDRVLFHGRFPDWKLRVQIATAIARGILYLHDECTSQIIHCDIKPQNILLDENSNAKITDFGIAKLMGADQTRTATEARGTRGYIAPEWYKNQPITARVDVYSFGVMLLEIICCRKNLDMNAPENEIILSEWVYECLKNGRVETLVEVQEEGEGIDVRQLERKVMVGIWCIQEDPMLRPSIRTVAEMLEGTIDVQMPPCPRTSVEIAVLPSPES